MLQKLSNTMDGRPMFIWESVQEWSTRKCFSNITEGQMIMLETLWEMRMEENKSTVEFLLMILATKYFTPWILEQGVMF